MEPLESPGNIVANDSQPEMQHPDTSSLRRALRLAASTAATAILVACGGGGGGSPTPTPPTTPPADTRYLQPAGVTRAWLSAADLQAAKAAPDSPLHNSHFMPVGASAPATSVFSGTIHLTSFALRTDDAAPAEHYVDLAFPAVDLRFASDGNDLIPVDRGILATADPTASRLILGPGNVWSEAGDGGWSRASFPFEVVSPTWNLTRNGIATFVYNDTQVSALRVQMVQESLGGANFYSDLWGTLAASYQPGAIDGHDALVAAFRQEQSGYLPQHDWSEIQPQLGIDVATFDDGMAAERISMTGLVKDSVIYRLPCATRYGDYPFCQQMRAGAFSATKSLGAAVAFLRLAQKYGDGVAGLLIRDYVHVTAAHDGWDHVTFLNALNMATGIGDNGATAPIGTGLHTLDDENTSLTNDVFSTQGEAAMLAKAFTQGKFSWGPGVEMRYDSIHYFILSAAMDAFLKQQEGPDAHLWDMVATEVLQPIGIAHAPMMHTVESDGSRGIPFLDIGLYPTADDAAKIALLFQAGGAWHGQQLLSAALTAKALYRTADQGLRGAAGWDTPDGDNRYLMSFWSDAWNDGKGCTARVPYMSGAGANVVALLPNGVVAYRFTHENSEYDGFSLVQAGATLGAMCP